MFALALGGSTNKSLNEVSLQINNISDEGMVDIITALSMLPHLKLLNLVGNGLRKNGCVALATLLGCSATELQQLYISRNEVNDEGIEALVPALLNCNRLKDLYISDNPSITTRGWQRLATVLEAPNLAELYIQHNNIDDEAAAAFANALMNNQTLHTLFLGNNRSLTAVGWQSFSKTLCDTSSVNATFLSNHTLRCVGANANASASANEIIGPLLELNARNDKKEVATIKILQSHDDFDMLPFFEWEFKVLPLVLSWLERASSFTMPQYFEPNTWLPREFEPNIEPRKLSTIYKFVRGMPVLYVETRLRKELEDIKVAESQLEEEELQEEFRQRKESIMRKLGQKSESC